MAVYCQVISGITTPTQAPAKCSAEALVSMVTSFSGHLACARRHATRLAHNGHHLYAFKNLSVECAHQYTMPGTLMHECKCARCSTTRYAKNVSISSCQK
ncbi:hypothetical protein MTO96_050716 [Rhipicephalus appendiculatus]